MQNLYLSDMTDSQYVRDAIGESFGKCEGTNKLFTASHADTRVAVVSTLARRSRLCLFTNYNSSQRNENAHSKDDDVVRADIRELDVSISDA